MDSGGVVTQVEETFMQHVVQYWQGSSTEVDGAAAMQLFGLEAAANGGPASDGGGQANSTPREDLQEGDPGIPVGLHAQTRALAVAGKHALCLLVQPACFPVHQALYNVPVRKQVLRLSSSGCSDDTKQAVVHTNAMQAHMPMPATQLQCCINHSKPDLLGILCRFTNSQYRQGHRSHYTAAHHRQPHGPR